MEEVPVDKTTLSQFFVGVKPFRTFKYTIFTFYKNNIFLATFFSLFQTARLPAWAILRFDCNIEILTAIISTSGALLGELLPAGVGM